MKKKLRTDAERILEREQICRTFGVTALCTFGAEQVHIKCVESAKTCRSSWHWHESVPIRDATKWSYQSAYFYISFFSKEEPEGEGLIPNGERRRVKQSTAMRSRSRDKMASASLKGTRKTYSFEERRILISLINKHEIVEDRQSDPASLCKRKSAWSLITEEYNSTVGPLAARSAVQLRRCWENMKACKRNREENRCRGGTKTICQSTKDESWAKNQCWEAAACGQTASEAPTSTGTVGLPPNVVFEPADSEPFALQSVCTARPQKLSCSRKDVDSCRDLGFVGTFSQMIVDGNRYDAISPSYSLMGNCHERSVEGNADSLTVDQSVEDIPEKSRVNSVPSASRILTSPLAMLQQNRKRKSVQREEELHMLALTEAQMKVDIAAMLKEEARIKLEEAHYRKEEARLRMLLFTHKLDRIKED